MIFELSKKPTNLLRLLREVNFDIRFTPDAETVAVEFDIIDGVKKLGFDDLEKIDMPIISKELKDKYKNFDYYPQYKLRKDDYSIFVGSNILVLSIGSGYKSWDSVSNMVKDIVGTLKGIKFTIDQISVNYINTAKDTNFLEKLNLNSCIDSIVNNAKKSFSSTLFYKGDAYSIVLSLSNHVKIKLSENDKVFEDGTLIDIKAVTKLCEKDRIYDMINDMHDDIENCYFGILNKIG